LKNQMHKRPSLIGQPAHLPRELNTWIDYNSRSRVMSTERTILSPFTKEYRVLVTMGGIRLFLEGYS
ncbi:hypothetical protein V6Z12_D11G390300, partial [Gossypium hirsutum]